MSGLSPASAAPVAGTRLQVADTTGVAEWARVNDMSGLSPASAGTVGAANSGSLASWAEANGLSGLSPASLRPSP